jgi:hypothetical protein
MRRKTGTLLRKVSRQQMCIWRDCKLNMSVGNCKLKQWDITTHLLTKAKVQNSYMTKCWWETEKKCSFIAGENAKWKIVWQLLTDL